MAAAQTLLRPLCEAQDANAWWLLAHTTTNTAQKRFALEKVIAINPQHEIAAKLLADLPKQPTEAPITKPQKDERKQKTRDFSNPSYWIRLLIATLTII